MGRPIHALAVALGAVALGGAGVPIAWAAPAPTSTTVPVATAGSSGRTNGPMLSLVAETPWVGPGQAMTVQLSVNGIDRSSASLGIAFFNCLTSRSALAATMNGNAVGIVENQTTVALDSLPADRSGTVTVTVPVDDGSSPPTGTGPLTAQLHCAGGPGGVYPLRFTLVGGDGTRTTLYTYLVYANAPANTERLRLAWVVPLAPPPGTVSSPTSADTIDSMSTLLAEVTSHSSVPLTLQPAGASVTGLSADNGSTRQRAQHVLAQLQSLGTDGTHEVLAQGYVPVDAQSLVASSLQGELAQQVTRAQQVLAPMRPAADTWVAGSATDQTTMAQLEHLGFTHVVLPASSVSISGAQTLTATRPFTLPAGRGLPPLAVESDTALTSHLAAADGPDPALAAAQFLADVALVYYEEPNLDTARGVVAVPPANWSANPAFMNAVLDALASDPLIEPVTVDSLFSTVPISTLSHRLATPSGTSTQLTAGHAVRTTRQRLIAFAGAVDAAGQSVVRSLDDGLLGAEDVRLKPSQQSLDVNRAGQALTAQLGAIAIRTDTIRLTSTAAKVPITLTKQSGYGITGVLSVTGDKVQFPGGTAQSPGAACTQAAVHSSAGRATFRCTATLGFSTNAVYVEMRSRASGDFRLTVTLTSPSGGLVLASDQVTVRSTSVSLVAIILSGVALAVLLAWWARTLWRGKRPPRHAQRARGRVPDVEPEPEPAR